MKPNAEAAAKVVQMLDLPTEFSTAGGAANAAS